MSLPIADCLSATLANDLLGGYCSASQREHAARHVDVCDACRDLLVCLLRSGQAAEGDTDEVDDSELVEGSYIGRYQLQRIIGMGAMGVVYAARDPQLERTVAIKLIRPERIGELGMERRLAIESKAMARISHTNVVSIHDIGMHDEKVFIAMEWIDGLTLGAWLESRKRSRTEILEAFAQAAAGLIASHEAGVVHRDFKPQNVLVEQSGRVLVTDFGLASPRRETLRAHVVDDDSGLDTSYDGQLAGTPAYMAPEQYLGTDADARSDQYSFCVALYEALLGCRPHQAETRGALAKAVVHSPIDLPANANLPIALKRALVRGLEKDPKERHDSMRDLLPVLAPAIESPKRGTMILVAVVGVLTLAAALWAWRSNGQAPVVMSDDSCDGAAQLAEIWNPDREQALRLQVASRAVDEDPWPRIQEGLNTATARWQHSYRLYCQSKKRPEVASELLESQSLCLRERLDAIDSRVELLLHANLPLGTQVDGIEGLARMSPCVGPEFESLASDPEQLKAVSALWTQLTVAEMINLSGEYAYALPIVEALAIEADLIGYGPLQSDVGYLLGSLQSELGMHAEAEQSLRKAALVASAAGDDKAAAEAWTTLITLVVGHPDSAMTSYQYAEHARSALDRLGNPVALEANYSYGVGSAKLADHELDEALVLLEQAELLFEEADDGNVVIASQAIAMVHLEQGSRRAAVASLQAILAEEEALWGVNHPQTESLLLDIGGALGLLGRHAEASETLTKALAIRISRLSETHPEVAELRSYLAERLLAGGKSNEAAAHLDRVQGTAIETLSIESQAGMLLVRAQAEHAQGDIGGALSLSEKAHELIGNRQGLATQVRADGHALRGELWYAKGQYEQSIVEFKAGLTLYIELRQSEAWLATIRTKLARSLLSAGRVTEAMSLIKLAVAVQPSERAAEDTGETQFVYAQLLRLSGEHKRARQLGLASQVSLRDSELKVEKQLDQVTRWLAGD